MSYWSTFNLLPEGLSDEAYGAGVDFSRLVVRVLNDDLRAELERLHNEVSAVEVAFLLINGNPVDEQLNALDATMQNLTALYVKVNLALGEQLRSELAWIPDWADPSLKGK